jgi:hypothetical protein
MKCLYKLKWSAGEDEWHLCNPLNDDSFVMKFPDCENFRRQFDKPDKRYQRLYVVDVHVTAKDTQP